LIVVLAACAGALITLLVIAASQQSGRQQARNPNLRPCPDCGRYISVRANLCPHCGGPVKGV
jgi:hypothetical protein